MRKITNSAGLVTATPMMQMSLPLSRSSWVIVVRSHLTKKASSGFMPISAPSLQTRVRNSVMVALTRPQSFSLFGSKTTHWVP